MQEPRHPAAAGTARVAARRCTAVRKQRMHCPFLSNSRPVDLMWRVNVRMTLNRGMIPGPCRNACRLTHNDNRIIVPCRAFPTSRGLRAGCIFPANCGRSCSTFASLDPAGSRGRSLRAGSRREWGHSVPQLLRRAESLLPMSYFEVGQRQWRSRALRSEGYRHRTASLRPHDLVLARTRDLRLNMLLAKFSILSRDLDGFLNCLRGRRPRC